MRPRNEIDRVTSWALDRINRGESYRGMTYEDGIRDALDWVTETTDEAPDQE